MEKTNIIPDFIFSDEEDYLIECVEGQAEFDENGWQNFIYEDEYVDDDEPDNYYDGYCEWSEEDAWDALTDGMYGDMPSNPIAYDAMMDALGY